MRGLCQDHPLADGNKRTAWLATDVFFRLNGNQINASESESVRFALDVAQDHLDLDAVASWLRARQRNIEQEED